VERFENFTFLVVHINKESSWSTHKHSREESMTTSLPPKEAEMRALRSSKSYTAAEH
jgi:hypothetical protein